MAFAGPLLAIAGCSVGQWSRKRDIKCFGKQISAHSGLVEMGCSSPIAPTVGQRVWSSALSRTRRDARGHCAANGYTIVRSTCNNVPRGFENGGKVRSSWVPRCQGPNEVGLEDAMATATAERDSLMIQGMRGSDDMYDNAATSRGSKDCNDGTSRNGDATSVMIADDDGSKSSPKRACDDDQMENCSVSLKPCSITDVACQLKFVVPNSLSGCIIGKSGGNLNRIREKTGVFVQASAAGSTVASSKDRMIIIAGESMSYCLWALEELVDSIRKAGKDHMLMDGSKYSLRQVIPGSSTAKVFSMQSRLLAYVQTCIGVDLSMDPRPPNACMTPFRLVRYSSHSLDSLLQGVAKVSTTVDSETYQNEIKEIKSIVLRVVKVPKSRVGVIIGAKGMHLKALEDVLHCKFAIGKDSTDSKDAYITIWGHPKNVYVAVQVLILKSNEMDGPRVATSALKKKKTQDQQQD
eukprot:jgi/Picsp_1/3895/NSC_01407-R1_far upstream element binding protein 3